MCYGCCAGVCAWCKSFTRTERVLVILEIILLVIFIGFLIFLVLHLVACADKGKSKDNVNLNVDTIIENKDATTQTGNMAESTDYSNSTQTTATAYSMQRIKCTLKPSLKTTADERYYMNNRTEECITSSTTSSNNNTVVDDDEDESEEIFENHITHPTESDGEIEYDRNKNFLALFKVQPSRDKTFICSVTVVAQFWALTSASCVYDTAFKTLLMVRRSTNGGNIYTFLVTDVQIHPKWQSRNKNYDIALLRSKKDFNPNPKQIIMLASILDYLEITAGKMLTILGYGKFRHLEGSRNTEPLRSVNVYLLPWSQCAGNNSRARTRRGLRPRGAVVRGGCGRGVICAGVLHARGPACHYCTGTPLLHERLLVGVRTSQTHCGRNCEPATYVSVAAVQDWLAYVINK